MSRNVELWATYTDMDLELMEREEQRNILHDLNKDAARLRLQWIRDELECRAREVCVHIVGLKEGKETGVPIWKALGDLTACGLREVVEITRFGHYRVHCRIMKLRQARHLQERHPLVQWSVRGLVD